MFNFFKNIFKKEVVNEIKKEVKKDTKEEVKEFSIEVYGNYFIPCYKGNGIDDNTFRLLEKYDFYTFQKHKIEICSKNTEEEALDTIENYRNSIWYQIDNLTLSKTIEVE